MADGSLLSGQSNVAVPRFVIDSKSVGRGDFFVALPGERTDGHRFVGEAIRRGAAGLLVSKKIPDSLKLAEDNRVAIIEVSDTKKALQDIARAHRKKLSPTVISLTGSNGKTTTKDMILQILEDGGGSVLGTQGNLNSQIGLPLMLMELTSSHRWAVFEMGASQRGEIASLASMALPRLGLITNVGRAHLEFFGSLEGVAEAKWELMDSLPPDGIAFLNADDPFLMARRDRVRCECLTYGFSRSASVRAESVSLTPDVEMTVSLRGRSRRLRLSVPGRFNASNALGAIAVSDRLGVGIDQIEDRLRNFKPSPYRMQVQVHPTGAILIQDLYNANPSSMKESLISFVESYPEKERVAVLGGMRELGDRAEEEHAALGELLGGLPLSRCYFVGPEGPWVRSGFRRKNGGDSLVLCPDKETAARQLRPSLVEGTAFLFKASRGVKLEEVCSLLMKKPEETR
ncbi:MAG TPA: UDP-N-acetylmuramoyl-tripeptide--D-alanyl-D-alanine ligase [Elusimicrobiota bacterium]|nr:UDP-N-acetylmuramoyl-tripeptide--D-alanyl-D-alanine ligase [Elusimicrobiota bacterium]